MYLHFNKFRAVAWDQGNTTTKYNPKGDGWGVYPLKNTKIWRWDTLGQNQSHFDICILIIKCDRFSRNSITKSLMWKDQSHLKIWIQDPSVIDFSITTILWLCFWKPNHNIDVKSSFKMWLIPGQIFLAWHDRVSKESTTISQEYLATHDAQPRIFGDPWCLAKNIWRPMPSITNNQCSITPLFPTPRLHITQGNLAFLFHQETPAKQRLMLLDDLPWKNLLELGLHEQPQQAAVVQKHLPIQVQLGLFLRKGGNDTWRLLWTEIQTCIEKT